MGSPIIASVDALAGNAATLGYAAYLYAHSSSLHDVTSGAPGGCGTALCDSGTGGTVPPASGCRIMSEAGAAGAATSASKQGNPQ